MPGLLIQSTPGRPFDLTEAERFALRNLLAKTIETSHHPLSRRILTLKAILSKLRADIVAGAVSAGPALSASTEAVALSGRWRRTLGPPREGLRFSRPCSMTGCAHPASQGRAKPWQYAPRVPGPAPSRTVPQPQRLVAGCGARGRTPSFSGSTLAEAGIDKKLSRRRTVALEPAGDLDRSRDKRSAFPEFLIDGTAPAFDARWFAAAK
jgi:hypothetical protein